MKAQRKHHRFRAAVRPDSQSFNCLQGRSKEHQKTQRVSPILTPSSRPGARHRQKQIRQTHSEGPQGLANKICWAKKSTYVDPPSTAGGQRHLCLRSFMKLVLCNEAPRQKTLSCHLQKNAVPAGIGQRLRRWLISFGAEGT